MGDLAEAAGCSTSQAQRTVRHLLGPLLDHFDTEVSSLDGETVMPRQLACLLHTSLDKLRAAFKPTAESHAEARQQYQVITAG